MGLEVDSKDVNELVKDHITQLTTKELVCIRNEQQKNLTEEQSSKDKKKAKESIPDAAIKKICSKRDDVQSFVEKYHPHALVANRAANHFNGNVISHFKKHFTTQVKTTNIGQDFYE